MKSFIILFTSLSMLMCGPDKFNPDENMKLIEKNMTELQLAVGDEAYYQAAVHGSVGIQVKLDIDNVEVLKVTKRKTDYKNTNRENRPGSDAATKTFVLKGLKKGNATITIKNIFRGTIKSEQTISCTIIE